MKLPILAIDPGPFESGWVILNEDGSVTGNVASNDFMAEIVSNLSFHVAIEMIASYGMAVGKEVFDTCVWIGRFTEMCSESPVLVYRKEVVMHICGTTKAKDANVRQALIDMFPATGGGKVPQIGTKKNPGPLFGFNSHMWPALALAITARDTK